MGRKKKNMVYLGIDLDGNGELSCSGMLKWDEENGWWMQANHSSSTLGKLEVALHERLLNLTSWPCPGELLVYDLDLDDGYIIHHEDIEDSGDE